MNHIIGIDLGTTNTTLAFASSGSSEILQFEIEQRISEEMEAPKASLPSFYFFPLEDQPPCVGVYAKTRGSELPDRLITSAKSWLCHDTIDRRESFLPLSDFGIKKSPVNICAAFLEHLRQTYEKTYNVSFAQQNLLVTVPASFDPGARQLVQEAACSAGYSNIRLIEEPLAAFYAWLHKHQDDWREILKVGDTVLVIDIGGGTTDFSLIGVGESAGDLTLDRKAVGDHLLLGGDNIDLALAHLASQKNSYELDEWQFQCLIHACREAKETLLSDNAADSHQITLQGRGSSLIGGSISLTLYREEVEKVLVDGFFPNISLDTPLQEEKRPGIAKIGLPYARDPRITVQLAHFLSQANSQLPNAVLFNGGTMKAAAFQNRLLSLLSDWRGSKVVALPDADFDFAVSRGAVYYGWTLQHQGIRVRAGTNRSYYIGVEGSTPAIPGVPPSIKKIQLVPFGMEEGSEVVLHHEKFALLLEEPALFRFYSQNTPKSEQLTELHPIETILHAQGEEGKMVIVTLKAKVTELGMLELWCVAEDERKWKLEFDIRKSD